MLHLWRARDAILLACSWNFWHTLDATHLTCSWNFWHPLDASQRVGKDYATWNEPGEHVKKITFERHGGWAGQDQNTCKYHQIPMQNEHVCAKTKVLLSFSHEAQSAVRVAHFEHAEMPKSTKKQGQISASDRLINDCMYLMYAIYVCN